RRHVRSHCGRHPSNAPAWLRPGPQPNGTGAGDEFACVRPDFDQRRCGGLSLKPRPQTCRVVDSGAAANRNIKIRPRKGRRGTSPLCSAVPSVVTVINFRQMTKRRSKGAYMISAVAEMYGIHPQTLRLYEREGLLKPSRTEGNTRLYT